MSFISSNRLVYNVMSGLVSSRVETAVNKMVVSYISGQYKERELVDKVVEIYVLRSLLADLESTVKSEELENAKRVSEKA